MWRGAFRPRLDGFDWSEPRLAQRLDASHKRKEIETGFIGAYHLEIGGLLLAQFGHTENVPP
jgi:hypothetical protein